LPERHPLARRKRVTLTELNRGPFPVLNEGHGFRDGLISACNEPRLEPAVALEGGEFATILAMVSVGMESRQFPRWW
jgi:DNA-binding transcriptional LysR family regulator